jgi:hypothetical protein
MQFSNGFQLVRALDGNSLKVFWVLIFMRLSGMGAQGEKAIQVYAGLSQNTVRRALDTLLLFDLVRRNKAQCGWILSEGLKQLPLVAEMLEAEGKSQYLTLSEATTTTTEILNTTGGKVEEAALKESNIDSLPERGDLAEIMEILHTAEIGEPTASRLAGLDYITPEYLDAHITKADYEDTDTALLIHRLQQHDPQPRTNSNGHYHKCDCERCQRSKYTKFATDF